MKVLVVIEREGIYRLLVKLPTQKLVEEVLGLVNKRRHSQAMISALTKGRFEKEVGRHELAGLKADLILSENSVSWDLIK